LFGDGALAELVSKLLDLLLETVNDVAVLKGGRRERERGRGERSEKRDKG
jgi:hypothetical protein